MLKVIDLFFVIVLLFTSYRVLLPNFLGQHRSWDKNRIRVIHSCILIETLWSVQWDPTEQLWQLNWTAKPHYTWLLVSVSLTKPLWPGKYKLMMISSNFFRQFKFKYYKWEVPQFKHCDHHRSVFLCPSAQTTQFNRLCRCSMQQCMFAVLRFPFLT